MTRTALPSAVETNRLLLFLFVLVAFVAGFSAITWYANIDLLTLGPLYMFTPAVAGLVVCLSNNIALTDVGLRVGRRRWLVIAAISWPPIALFIALLSTAVPGVSFDLSVIPAELGVPPTLGWIIIGTIAVIAIMVAEGATINAVLGFGEEFGWRGYLLWELAPLGFWKASLVIGTVWGLWHMPLLIAGLNYPSFPLIGVAGFTITCIVMSPIYTYLVVKSGSVLPAAIFHGVFNAAGLVGLAATDDPVLRELVASEGGIIGITVFLFVAAGIALTGTPHLTREFASHPPGVTETQINEPDTQERIGVGKR